MSKIKTIHEIDIDEKKYLNAYKFQENLTSKLDNYKTDFDQKIINEIVLWKVNRYAKLDDSIFKMLNNIEDNKPIEEELTKQILRKLLAVKGIRIAVASTILRFKNPKIYQILDQRVYRVLTGKPLKISSVIEEQIDCYLNYLKKLNVVCHEYNLNFKKIDRTLYEVDKDINKEVKIKY